MSLDNISEKLVSTKSKSMNIVESPFDNKRYDIIEKIPKRGCWGEAYRIKDNVTGSRIVAKDFNLTQVAKKQLLERNLTLTDVIKNEYTELRTPDGVVPTWIEQGKNGKLFLIMPEYEKDFEQVLEKETISKPLDKFDLEKILKWSSNILSDISNYNKEYKKAHCDIKPDNFFVDKNGKLWLGDSGTSTGTSDTNSEDLRSNMGFIYTRAPENFYLDAKPTISSDVWSTGSLLYRLFTGKYLLQDELDNSKDPGLFITNLDKDIYSTMLKQKLKDVPKEFRPFFKKCLAIETRGPKKRFESTIEMKTEWESVVKNLNPYEFYKSQFKKLAVPILGVGGALALIGYASKMEPTKTSIPESYIQINLDVPQMPNEHLIFNRDTIPMYKAIPNTPHLTYANLKSITDNAYVAHFVKAYDAALSERGITKLKDTYTDAQAETYMQYTSSDQRMYDSKQELSIITKSLEVAMSKSVSDKGTIDLEDVFAIARVGENKVNLARRLSKSFDFKDYSCAKTSDGEYVIPLKEQQFIVGCLQYTSLGR